MATLVTPQTRQKWPEQGEWTYDREKKQEAYRLARVKEYWIGDYRAKTIDVLVLDKEAYVLVDQYQTGDMVQSVVLTGFSIAVANVFSK